MHVMLRIVVVLLGVLLAWLVPAGSSSAGLMLEFAVGGTPASSFEIAAPGQAVQIQVQLTQTGPLAVGEPDLKIDGLALAGFRVSFGNPAGIAAVSNIEENPAFNDGAPIETIDLIGATADLNEAVSDVFLGPFVTADENGRIVLGTFTFTGLSPGATSISVAEYSAGDDDFYTGTFTLLDDFGIAPGLATLTVTPEPGTIGLSLAVCGVVAAVSGYRARRKRGPTGTADDRPGATVPS